MSEQSGNSPKCAVVPPGGGEQYWLVGDHLCFKTVQDRFCFAEATVPAGHGPPPHVHFAEDEFFYILDGEGFHYSLENETFLLKPGDAIFLPRGKTHVFRNVGSKPGRFLVGSTPGGFGRFTPDAGCACKPGDTSGPPLDDTAKQRLSVACGKHNVAIKFDHACNPNASAIDKPKGNWVWGVQVRTLLGSKETNGQLSLAELNCQPGRGVPPHTHREMDEVFFVLEGQVDFIVDGQNICASPGTFIHVPPNCVHGFRNSTSAPAKMVDYHFPGGFERFFRENGTDADTQLVLKPEELAAICGRHGMALA